MQEEVENKSVALSIKAAHRTELATEATATMAAHAARVHHQNAPYKKVEKLQQQVNQANVNAAYRAAVRDNPELQTNNVKRFAQKQRIKRQYAKEYRKAQKAGSKGSAAAKKAKDAVSSTGQAVITAIKNHKGGLVVIGALVLLVIMVFSSLSSCSVMMEGAMGSILGTSYTSEDPDILQTESNYTALESGLRNELANIENTYSGYDEYALDSMKENLQKHQAELANLLQQTEDAKVEVKRPFPQEAELAEKSNRLNVLNVALNIGGKDAPKDRERQRHDGKTSIKRLLRRMGVESAASASAPKKETDLEVAI